MRFVDEEGRIRDQAESPVDDACILFDPAPIRVSRRLAVMKTKKQAFLEPVLALHYQDQCHAFLAPVIEIAAISLQKEARLLQTQTRIQLQKRYASGVYVAFHYRLTVETVQ